MNVHQNLGLANHQSGGTIGQIPSIEEAHHLQNSLKLLLSRPKASRRPDWAFGLVPPLPRRHTRVSGSEMVLAVSGLLELRFGARGQGRGDAVGTGRFGGGGNCNRGIFHSQCRDPYSLIVRNDKVETNGHLGQIMFSLFTR